MTEEHTEFKKAYNIASLKITENENKTKLHISIQFKHDTAFITMEAIRFTMKKHFNLRDLQYLICEPKDYYFKLVGTIKK